MSQRPSRNQAAPPPLPGGQYCLDCGRLLPKDTNPSPTPRKFCSSSCRIRAKSPRRADLYKHLAESFHQVMIPDNHALCGDVQQIAFRSSSEGVSWSSEVIPEVKEVDQREETRRSARRLVQFGWKSQGVNEEKAVEAVQNGRVVEASFAKGEWGIRWVS